MSVNCVRCVVNERTGPDLLCNDCRAAPAIVALIGILRGEEGSGVTINCQNPEGSGPDNEAVDVTDDWTGWEPRRFRGRTLEEALRAAIEARVAAKRRT